MTCSCGYEFCYACGERWISNPCRNGCSLWEESRLEQEVAFREPNVNLRYNITRGDENEILVGIRSEKI